MRGIRLPGTCMLNPRDTSIETVPTLGPKACKSYQHWTIRFPRERCPATSCISSTRHSPRAMRRQNALNLLNLARPTRQIQCSTIKISWVFWLGNYSSPLCFCAILITHYCILEIISSPKPDPPPDAPQGCEWERGGASALGCAHGCPEATT